MSNNLLKYEFGVLKEYGENEAIVDVYGKEYHILLSDEEDKILQSMLLNENISYVGFDTENEKIVFDDVFNMKELDNEVVSDIDYGVSDDGKAE
ncbi:hypothetical protein [Oceanobacillus sp. FSL K6-0251]|uniref:hypothetical protein n=1 Tax=Oceanobacillus sp. FSL K6-0251 TaxID=2921602 RepID=UPI0030F9D19E